MRRVSVAAVAALVCLIVGCAAWEMAKADDQVSEAEALEKKEDFSGAATFYQAALHYCENAYPDGCNREILYRSRLSSCLLKSGRPKDALTESETAVALARRLNGPNHPSVSLALIPHALALESLGRHKEAREAGALSQRIIDSQPR